jgi:hypothetical protein
VIAIISQKPSRSPSVITTEPPCGGSWNSAIGQILWEAVWNDLGAIRDISDR